MLYCVRGGEPTWMRLAFSLVVQDPFKAGRGSRCLIAPPRIGTPRLSADITLWYAVFELLHVEACAKPTAQKFLDISSSSELRTPIQR
jgi:hypothetical protein